MKFYLICFFIFVVNIHEIFASASTIQDSTKTKNQLLAYPVVFYLPETRWGFGGAGLYTFRFKGESKNTNPSQFQFAVSYTQNKQVLVTFPFELYLHDNTWKFKGDLNYFEYLYKFYGTGIHSLESDKEFFFAKYPRIRLDVLRRYKSFFTGIRLRYDRMKITESGPLLSSGNYTGQNGGNISGLGFLCQWDKRDFIYNPTKGFYLEAEVFINDRWVGSDFSYRRFSLDFAKYTRLAKDHTIALQVINSHNIGNPIFYDLIFFGSPRVMRGYQDRRFLDKNMLVFQSEYRFPIYKRLNGVTFLSMGTVASQYDDLFSNPYKISYGAGLRYVLNKKDRVRLRLDYGLTPSEGSAFYLTVNDAF
jgi:outer membrane protein assembly factor BamA